MNLREASRLRRNAIVIYGENSRGPASWWGRVLRVTPAGGVLVAPARWHWREGPPPPPLEEEMLTTAWDDVGPHERWIPAAWIVRAA